MNLKQSLVSIKFNSADPSMDVLNDILAKMGSYLPKNYDLRNPRVNGKYVYFDVDLNVPDSLRDEVHTYISGMIAGILMEKGVEII